jgi:hypothetical protein
MADDAEPEEEEAPNAQGLSRSERQDLSAALEHLVAVGTFNRHQQWRQHAWNKRKLALAPDNNVEDNVEDDNVNGSTESVSQGKSKVRKVNEVLQVHAADVRIYGKNGMEAVPWPAKSVYKIRERHVPDTAWDCEHGDQIHPCRFSAMRLSMQPATAFEDAADDRAIVEPSNQQRQQDISIATDEAPRALLLRCWERAIHAASCAIVPETSDPMEKGSIPQRAADRSASTDEHGDALYPYGPAAAKQQCQALQFPKLPPVAPFDCPSCGINFDQTERLVQHYYGSENQRGCCWAQIRLAQRQLLDRLLQSEVQTQTQTLMRLLLTNLQQPQTASKSNTKTTPEQVFDWQDVLRVLEQSLATSKAQTPCTVNADNVLQQTLQVEIDKPPLLMNKRVMDAIAARLNDRYAKVPK